VMPRPIFMEIPRSAIGQNAQPPRLLLVDDDPDQLRLLVEALRSTSYRLSLAMNGLQGYDRAVSIQPDLIVLDVRMPRVDGFALCRRLKANASTKRIPVIFLSSASDIQERLTGLGGGAVDYILKPYDAQEVVARVNIHLALAGKGPVATLEHVDTPCDEDTMLVTAAQRELVANLSATPRLGEVAARIGVHERRLARAFQKALGVTLFEYLRGARMQEAQRLLVQTSLGMVAISHEVGFSNAANFSTAFRESTGVSPSEYRLRNTQSRALDRLDEKSE